MIKHFRVPVRKPGLNNGQIFNNQTTLNLQKQQQLLLHQKTASVPNLLYQQPATSVSQPAPPPPPPPPAPPQSQIPNLSSRRTANNNNNNNNNTIKSSSQNIYTMPNATAAFQTSSSSDTLVHDNAAAEPEYEPPHDYDIDDKNNQNDELDCQEINELAGESSSQVVYTSQSPIAAASKPAVVNNRSVLSIGSSPLTPRQIKQRNTAKRTSITSSSSSSSTKPVNTNTTSPNDIVNDDLLTSAQQRDLDFLQSQKFDSDFVKTTNELFVRYPTAKISISVVNTNASSGMNEVTRQVEIDRNMFDKICAFQQQQQASTMAKIQPQTPVRTSSVMSEVVTQQQQTNRRPPTVPFNQPKQQSVKSELERAIENRLRRTSLAAEALSNETDQLTVGNKRNMPRDPPPPLPPPPAASMANNNDLNSFPPPPSPKELRRLNSAAPAHTVSSSYRVFSPPPPAPPLPSSFAGIKPVKTSLTPPSPPPPPPIVLASSSSTKVTSSVKTIVNSLQQQQQQHQSKSIDPRMSSDFGALIAKKAAEKRAKFQENMKPPVSNAVTFQPDGTKVFANNAATVATLAQQQSSVIYRAVTTETVESEIHDNNEKNYGKSFIDFISEVVRKKEILIYTQCLVFC